MLKGYFAAVVLLVLGLAGVGTLTLQASQRLGEEGKDGSGRAKPSQAGPTGAEGMEPRVAARPEGRPRGEGPERPGERAVLTRPGPDDGAGRPDPTRPGAGAPDGGAGPARPGADPTSPRDGPGDARRDAPRDTPRDPVREVPLAEGPPRPDGPEPVLVIELEEGKSKPSPADFRRVRDLVEKHGYKDQKYLLTAYAGELPKAKRNRALGRARCQQVLGLFRKRGVSRRWLACQAPVFRERDGAPTEAHRAPAWRRVEVRVTK